MQQLTIDDSWAQEQVDDGLLAPRAGDSPTRARMRSRTGSGPTRRERRPRVRRPSADAPGPAGAVHRWPVELRAHVRRARRRWSKRCRPGRLRPPSLARSPTGALSRGGRDNITVVVVDIQPRPRRPDEQLHGRASTRTSTCRRRHRGQRDRHRHRRPGAGGPARASARARPRSSSSTRPARWSTRGRSCKPPARRPAAAIDCIRDGVAFGVIAGYRLARSIVYPQAGGLAVGLRREPAPTAARRQSRLQADGGTAIGTWLTLARELFDTGAGPRSATRSC